MKRVLTTIAAVLTFVQLASANTVDSLAFMSGKWRSERNGTITEELWTSPQAGAMFGISRTIRGEKTVFFEFLRVETRGGGLYYVAQPGGRPPTPFKLVSFDGKVATFENPENDFPSKIVYEKLGDDAIRAGIAGKQNGKDASESWEFKRVK